MITVHGTSIRKAAQMLGTRSARQTPTPHPPDVTDPVVSLAPRLPHRWAAGWAGRRDGKRGVTPDPETGLTPYLNQLCSLNATMVESERLRTAADCAPIDQERARQVERRERVLEQLSDASHQALEDGADGVAAVRARRARAAALGRWSEELAAIAEQLAVLEERRADRVTVGALRIRRCTARTEQVVARYWRFFQRHHPELPDLRAGYGVPVVPVPPHPLEKGRTEFGPR